MHRFKEINVACTFWPKYLTFRCLALFSYISRGTHAIFRIHCISGLYCLATTSTFETMEPARQHWKKIFTCIILICIHDVCCNFVHKHECDLYRSYICAYVFRSGFLYNDTYISQICKYGMQIDGKCTMCSWCGKWI